MNQNPYPPGWPVHVQDQLDADFARGHDVAYCSGGYCSMRGKAARRVRRMCKLLDLDPETLLSKLVDHGMPSLIVAVLKERIKQ